MTAAQIVDQLRASGVRLEARGEHIWFSDARRAAELIPEVKRHKEEVLRHLRLRQYDRLTASARTLARFLDDTEEDMETRWCRLPEYRELLEQIAELQPYIEQYEAARGARYRNQDHAAS